MPKCVKCQPVYGSRSRLQRGVLAVSLWLGGLLVIILSASMEVAADSAQSSGSLPRFATSTVNPWGYWRTDGSMGGLLVDFAEALAGQAGQPFDNDLQPYPRVMHSLASGYADFAVLFDNGPLPSSVERVVHVVDTEILIVGLEGLRPRTGKTSFTDPQDLAGLTIGHIRGSLYGPVFDEARHFQRLPISTIEQGLAMLLQGRIDAMASTDYSLFYALKTMQLEASKIRPLLSLGYTSGSLYMSRTSSWRHLASTYRRAVEHLCQSGKLATIFPGQFGWPAPTPQ